jgi:hypothetical protein
MKNQKKILLLQGSIMEVGQSLTNLYGLNPDFKIVEKFESSSVRPVPGQSSIAIAGAQPQYEPLLIIILVYENPGELKGPEFQPAPAIKGTLKN